MFSFAEENGGALHTSAKDGDIMRVLGVAVVAVDGDFLVLVEGAGTVAPLELLILSCLFQLPKKMEGQYITQPKMEMTRGSWG